MSSNLILVGNLIDDLLEELTLRNFHGIYRFLPVLTKVDDHVGGTSLTIEVDDLNNGVGTTPTYSIGDHAYDNHFMI